MSNASPASCHSFGWVCPTPLVALKAVRRIKSDTGGHSQFLLLLADFVRVVVSIVHLNPGTYGNFAKQKYPNVLAQASVTWALLRASRKDLRTMRGNNWQTGNKSELDIDATDFNEPWTSSKRRQHHNAEVYIFSSKHSRPQSKHPFQTCNLGKMK